MRLEQQTTKGLGGISRQNGLAGESGGWATGGVGVGGGVFDELYMPLTFRGACLIYELEKKAKQLEQHWALSAVECNSQFP